MKNSNGPWFRMYCRIRNSEMLRHPKALTVFVFLLTRVTYKDRIVGGIRVAAGQCLTSWVDISDHTGLSRQTIRTALAFLKTRTQVTIKSTNRYSVITIVNWEQYQGEQETATTTSAPTATTQQPPNNHIADDTEYTDDIERERERASYPDLLRKLKAENPPSVITTVAALKASHASFEPVNAFSIGNMLQSYPEPSSWVLAIEDVATTFAGSELKVPMAAFRKALQRQQTTEPLVTFGD